MITLAQYFGKKTYTLEHEANALDLLDKRERLREEFTAATGIEPPICPNTGSEISGSPGGSGDGGFRAPDSKTGAARSSHKEARGVDDYDPGDHFDKWLDRFETGGGGNSKLEEYGLYREHPSATKNWVHLTTRPPDPSNPDKYRTFYP